MKICVINGSPKGKFSITLQTVLYLEKIFPEHEFLILNVGREIRAFEKDMSKALCAIRAADLILFSYPVYTFLVPSQLARFIELLKESGADISGKFATQITTSLHFYDMTAHRFIEENCNDLGLRVIHGFSAEMEDLLKEKGRGDAEAFFKYVIYCAENGIYEAFDRKASTEKKEYERKYSDVPKLRGKTTVIVADLKPGDSALLNMIEDFRAVYKYPTRIVNIEDFPFSGGCLSCFNCASGGKCIYKDGFDSFLREKIQTADAIVYAFTISDHSMGVRFKLYDDRQFCNGHRTVTEGMPFGYIINGDFCNEENLRTVIEARAEVGHNFLSGIGYDEKTIKNTALRLEYALREKYNQPRNFYGVGGMKIFRDLIYLMRGLMREDHRFYKKNGLYDFPQKKRGEILKMNLVGAMMRNPKIKAKMGNKMNEGMIAPYKKVIENAKK